jgi:hypothetical protein
MTNTTDSEVLDTVAGLTGEELETLAQGAYRAYGAVTEFKNYQGLPMPKWEDLTDKIREAWCAAALYVWEWAAPDEEEG